MVSARPALAVRAGGRIEMLPRGPGRTQSNSPCTSLFAHRTNCERSENVIEKFERNTEHTEILGGTNHRFCEDRRALDRRLDRALEDSFPASDPVSIVVSGGLG
jgi:hypothetical protein